MLWLIVIVLVVVAIAGLPPVSGGWHSYGYAPSSLVTVLVVVLLVLLLLGRL